MTPAATSRTTVGSQRRARERDYACNRAVSSAASSLFGVRLKITDRLVLSNETVKTHVSHLLRKLGVLDRAQAVVAAYESGPVVRGA